MMEDIGNEKLSLTERLNLIGTAGHVEKVRIWPHDAERIVSEERCPRLVGGSAAPAVRAHREGGQPGGT